MKPMNAVATLALLLASLGCFDCSGTGAVADAGLLPDAGVTTDGGPPADAGTPDAGVCGNGIIEAGEECDDGNLLNLDGCDATCHYEVAARFGSLTIQTGPAPSFCSPATNQLGNVALNATEVGFLNTLLEPKVLDAGTLNVLALFNGLADLTGVGPAGPFTVGFVSAATDPAKGTWPGGEPLDWWFLAQSASVNRGVPTAALATAHLASGQLTAGPSDLTVTLSPSWTAHVTYRSARMAATIAPKTSVPSSPPATLAAGLTVLESVRGTDAGQGLCGNLTVESLAQIPVPKVLSTASTNSATSCLANTGCATSHSYTYCGLDQPVDAGCNSLLDVLVGGCDLVVCGLSAVHATQPDVPSGTAVQPLALGAGNKVPPSVAQGDLDAYSTYFGFTATRVHLTGQACASAGECQVGQRCTAGRCQ